MRPTALRSILVCAALLALLAACRSGGKNVGGSKLQVAAGIGPVGALVERIGGDSVNVVCLLPSGADPEEFDPGTQALRQMSNSDIYFATGTLPFEHTLAGNFGAMRPDMRMVNLSEGIELIYGTHGDEPDPHTWMSVRNLAAMARNVSAALSEARPAAASYFNGRLAEYERQLAKADSMFTAQLRGLAGESFAVGHPSLSYMARDYSLRQLPLSSGTKESSAKGMRERIDSLRAANPRIFFAEPGTENDMASETATQLGIPVAQIDAMNPDVISQLTEAASLLANPKK